MHLLTFLLKTCKPSIKTNRHAILRLEQEIRGITLHNLCLVHFYAEIHRDSLCLELFENIKATDKSPGG